MLDVTERAAALIDLDGLRRQAQPVGPLGVLVRDATGPMGSGERGTWRRERKACHVLVAVHGAHPRLMAGLTDRLRSIDPVDDPLRRAVAGDADEADLFRLKRFAYQAWRVVTELETAGALKSYEAPALDGRTLERVLRSLEVGTEIRPRFTLDDAFDDRLGPLRARVRALRREETRLARALREATEARWGFRVHGGTIRVPAGHAALPAMIASEGLEVASTGTLEVELRLVPPTELAELREQVEADDAALAVVEEQVVAALGLGLASAGDALLATQAWIGRLDFRLAKVRLAADWPAWPEPGEETSALGAWLPVARARVAASGGTWQPVDVSVGRGVTLLTGPNMGGKTAALAVLAAVQVLGQLGYPAPARAATFRWFDRVDYVGGELGSFTSGLSSFAGEIAALGLALAAPGEALLLIDELGRGTSPAEGKAVARATARYLSDARHATMLVTHFANLAEDLPCRRLRVRGLAGVDDDALRADAVARGWQAALNSAMDYRLVEDDGTTSSSDALRIAELLDLPAELVAEARAILGDASERR